MSLNHAGPMKDLTAFGFDSVGSGCSTCIRDPGGLPEEIEKGKCGPSAIASHRIARESPSSRLRPFGSALAYSMSSALVTAFALPGDAEKELAVEPVAVPPSLGPILLKQPWT